MTDRWHNCCSAVLMKFKQWWPLSPSSPPPHSIARTHPYAPPPYPPSCTPPLFLSLTQPPPKLFSPVVQLSVCPPFPQIWCCSKTVTRFVSLFHQLFCHVAKLSYVPNFIMSSSAPRNFYCVALNRRKSLSTSCLFFFFSFIPAHKFPRSSEIFHL